MKSENFKAVGKRIRQVRKDAGLTQDEFAARINSDASYLSRVENGRQRASHTMVEAIHEQFNVTVGWIWSGGSEQDSGSSFTDYLVNNMTSKSGAKAGNNLIKKARNARSMGLLLTQGDKRVPADDEGFGYTGMLGIKIRLAAVRDSGISGSKLLQIANDDDLWAAAGEPDGWEFEILRGYYDFGGDRTLEQWMECLRILRWLRECITLALDSGDFGSAESA